MHCDLASGRRRRFEDAMLTCCRAYSRIFGVASEYFVSEYSGAAETTRSSMSALTQAACMQVQATAPLWRRIWRRRLRLAGRLEGRRSRDRGGALHIQRSRRASQACSWRLDAALDMRHLSLHTHACVHQRSASAWTVYGGGCHHSHAFCSDGTLCGLYICMCTACCALSGGQRMWHKGPLTSERLGSISIPPCRPESRAQFNGTTSLRTGGGPASCARLSEGVLPAVFPPGLYTWICTLPTF